MLKLKINSEEVSLLKNNSLDYNIKISYNKNEPKLHFALQNKKGGDITFKFI